MIDRVTLSAMVFQFLLDCATVIFLFLVFFILGFQFCCVVVVFIFCSTEATLSDKQSVAILTVRV